ncbi:HD domain-containing protein [Sinomicrobium weinanense]|uniref:5'-deoxynucleotidase n=1 Tax=Sinomicrobium weinanense TaxID=2842200 RepID=A0A926Q5Z2_9FLAO|nr:HD domain-containing protein [Sinomicrobium weinanense]MBC9798505.1 HD domain-containing protein [Sinomicrobium weinanense]MBU3122490.1 HD domain-containing protein [Sinomicrobium weinanense]
MPSNRLAAQIAFIHEIDKLKYIRRKTRLFNSDRNENDAEHSWHLAVMAIVLAEHADEDIDLLKVLKMVLIHDIVEIDAGDTFLFDTVKGHDNTEEELEAAKRIFGVLPEDQAEELIKIWQEFEARNSPEAKFARTLDRFEPVLQNISNKGGTWAEFDISYPKVMEKVKVIKNGSARIWDYSEARIRESVDQGILREQ